MAVIPRTPTKPFGTAGSEMDTVKNRNAEGNEVDKNENEDLGDSRAKRSRNKDPGVRKVGSRIYDPKTGNTCHQCRQKTTDLAVKCTNIRGNKSCTLKFCQSCLANRYGQQAAVAIELGNWTCPKCSGNCNCSLCLKKRGFKPTGILIHAAKAKGYSSVSEMIEATGSSVLNPENSPKVDDNSPKKRAAQEMVEPKLSSSPTHDKESAEEEDGPKIDHSSPKKKAAQKTEDIKLPSSQSHVEGSTEEEDALKADDYQLCMIAAEAMAELKSSSPLRHDEGSREKQVDNEVSPHITMPVGTELTTVCGIEMQPKDLGKALQFLEFCSAFGEILEVKKGQPECMLRDLIDGRSSRPGRFSLTTQFHIRVISLIQEERGEGSSDLSPARGKDSWVHALKECLCGSEIGSELQILEHLDKGAAGYENLNSSDKLTILNMLCDEVLGTARIRSWIDDQNSEHAGKAKEQKEKINSAKDKEKHLKLKMQDEVAKAIMERNAPLTISEHEALVSQIKLEVAQAHVEMLESTIMYRKRNRTSEAVRTESIYNEPNGRVHWRLNCMSESSQMLVQDVGAGNISTEEKWFSLDNEQKEMVEKHVNKLSGRKRRVAKVTPVLPC